MNILGNNSSKLNAVIFENRNKAYGAYEIRESYNDSLKKSILCLSGLVLLLFGSVYAYNKINAVPAEKKGIVLNDPTLDPIEYMIEVDNTPLEAPAENNTSAAAPEGGMATRIVDAAPTTTATTNTNPIGGVGSATATGVDPNSTVESTVTVSSPPVTQTITVVSKEPVIFAEVMPEFDENGNAGLMQYVASSVVYPEIAKEVGAQGIVYVSFVVNEVGKVESAKVLKGIGLGCDEEVLRVINKMPVWKKPGKNAGHPVKVRFNIPVAFRLK